MLSSASRAIDIILPPVSPNNSTCDIIFANGFSSADKTCTTVSDVRDKCSCVPHEFKISKLVVVPDKQSRTKLYNILVEECSIMLRLFVWSLGIVEMHLTRSIDV